MGERVREGVHERDGQFATSHGQLKNRFPVPPYYSFAKPLVHKAWLRTLDLTLARTEFIYRFYKTLIKW